MKRLILLVLAVFVPAMPLYASDYPNEAGKISEADSSIKKTTGDNIIILDTLYTPPGDKGVKVEDTKWPDDYLWITLRNEGIVTSNAVYIVKTGPIKTAPEIKLGERFIMKIEPVSKGWYKIYLKDFLPEQTAIVAFKISDTDNK